MALKNAYSKKRIDHIFRDIQKTLAIHGASQVLFEYGKDGKIYGITFIMQFDKRRVPIKLPARIQNVAHILEQQGFKRDAEQVYRIAWRNIEDWVTAQMAMIDIGMVKLEEVFLPYMTDETGRTFFEYHQKNQFLLT